MNEYRSVLLEKVKTLKLVKFSKFHYHPTFLSNMENHIVDGKEIGSNAVIFIERSFRKYFPGGLK